jgi:hypothetical protein
LPRSPFLGIVFALDFQIESEIAKADIGQKLLLVGREGFPVLIAGSVSRATELSEQISQILYETAREIGEEYVIPNWPKVLTDAVTRQKKRIANEITSGRYGIAYEEFLKIGNSHLPEGMFRDTLADIARTSLECDLLVLGFAQSDLCMFKVDSFGRVEACMNFCAIGSGYYIAEAALFQRSQSTNNALGKTLYSVYESMRMGARAPGVGEKFRIVLAKWEYWGKPTNEGNISLSEIKDEYMAHLGTLFKKYGPKTLGRVKLHPEWIEVHRPALVLTPKGEHSEEIQKELAKLSASHNSEDQP